MVKSLSTSQKLRGGYYTPEPIAQFLARWAIRSRHDAVLEPSCGDGELLVAAARTLLALQASPEQIASMLQGVEIDADEAQRARDRLQELAIPDAATIVHTSDFFSYAKDHYLEQRFLSTVLDAGQSFDAIIGNPPFIRYQSFAEDHQTLAFEMMRHYGFHPNRLTNAWVPFLVISAHLLTADGRLAFVIPAELFQVSYAAEIRRFLSEFFHRITLLTFKKLVFPDIQQEVILLLAEKRGTGRAGIRVVEFDGLRDFSTDGHASLRHAVVKPMDHSTEKWTHYFLDAKEIALLREIRGHPLLSRSGDVFDVDVGVVTGQNDFFVLNNEQIHHYDLPAEYLERLVSRSIQLEGAVFTEGDWQENVRKKLPSYLLRLPNVQRKRLPESAQNYVQFGEDAQWHVGYKCRNRSPWYVVPSVWIPDAFMLRQVHSYPKLVLNQAQATCTDTLHRVRFKGHHQRAHVTAAFMNSLTFAGAEVTGRSYGGGVLTFEPSEAERLPLPLHNSATLDLTEIDRLLRTCGIYAVLDLTDRRLLVDGLGLTPKEAKQVRGMWEKLRDRRINRK